MAQGSIYPRQLKDGTTVYDARYRTSDGRPAQKRGFRRRREAQAWLHQRLAAVERGEVISDRREFADYFDAWLAEHRPRLEDGTYRDYETHGRLRLKPFFGERRLAVITAADVRRYVSELVACGQYSAKTINNSLVVLRLALGHAEEDGLISRNPAASKPGHRDRIKLPAEHREMDYLRLDEIPRYLSACSETYRALAELLIATGLRISEALALTWADVHWSQRQIHVVRSRKRNGNGSTKGDSSRSVDFGPRLAAVLRRLHESRLASGRGTSVPIFVGPRGGRLTRSDVSRDLHKASLRGAGLRESLRLHDLRHTAAASWLTAGLPLIYVQRQLGHASITTTQAEYGHLEESFLQDAAARAEKAIWARELRGSHAHGRRRRAVAAR
jgi:integrase